MATVSHTVIGSPAGTALCRTTNAGRRALISTAPAAGLTTPAITPSSVDLPEPLAPTTAVTSARQAGSDRSPIVLGDYKQDAELERPTQISLIDTTTGTLELVDLGASYTFRSLARGPRGEGLVIGTDGRIHVTDPVKAEVTRTIPVTGSRQEPLEWQQPGPAIFVKGGTAYVTDPGKRQLHRIDLAEGKVTATASLPQQPNELSGVTAGAPGTVTPHEKPRAASPVEAGTALAR